MTNIIAIMNPEYLFKYGPGFGIPADFWIAKKEAFAEGTLPMMLYQDHGKLIAVTISDNPRLVAGSEYHETAMLFKLVRRAVLRLKDDLLRIWEGDDLLRTWEGEDHEKLIISNDELLVCWKMNSEQRQILTRLNARLLDVEKSIHERFEQLSKEYPGQCLSCRIHFILNKNDPEWADEDDNILASMSHDHREEYDPSTNWNDCPHLVKDENGKPEHLCWLYHELYDHTGLAWEDLLRVGQIWVTVKVNFDQYF